ncbi:MAG TPA: MBL fold metallo-hydrolase [Candidatus Nitrosotenuis sp.]|jgi:ribonuclease Z|nr:MBL fold metallo-hydrolase [Candidatus Nitrosotenuis sp.]
MILSGALVNEPWEDPAVYLELANLGQAWLLDCGFLGPLRMRDLVRVRRVFVSHFHIDHFIGFDHLLRVNLASARTLSVYGPAGVVEHVRGKLAGYAWNLIYDSQFLLRVHEVYPDQVRSVALPCQDCFAPRDEVRASHSGALELPEGVRVHCLPVDHGVPCFAYVLEEPPGARVDARALGESGLVPGAWVARLKELALQGRLGETLEVGGRTLPAAELARRLVRPVPGRRLAYVTDTAFNRATVEALEAAAAGADELWCEAAYLHQEEELARQYRHMTARQAALLAAELGARRLYLFHFSRRYQGNPRAHLEEARAVFPETHLAPRYLARQESSREPRLPPEP